MRKLFCFFFLLIFMMTTEGRANISVSTSQVFFDAASPRRAEVVKVSNTSTAEKTYRLKFVNFKQMPDGSYQPLEKSLPDAPFADAYLDFSPHSTTLKPGQVQTVRIVRKSMAAAADGEYVSHLLVQEMPAENEAVSNAFGYEGLKIDIHALYGITLPVVIDKGDLKSGGRITAASVKKSGQGAVAEVTVERSGNRSFRGNLIIRDDKGEIGRINDFKIFLTTPERTLKVPLSRFSEGKVQAVLEDFRTNAVVSRKNL